MVTTRIRRDTFGLTIACAWTIYNLSYLCNAFFYIGLVIYPTAHRAINVALIATLVFLLYPLRRGQKKEILPWYDILAILFLLVSCTYIVIKSGKLIYAWSDASPLEMVLGIGCTLCLLEATRRTVNWILPLIIILFFFYTIYSNYFPGFLYSTGFSYKRTVAWMYLSGDGIWGMIIGVASTVVAGFVIFGGFLKAMGASQFFIKLAISLAGSVRGGPAKAAVVASSFMGMLSGSVVANVVTTGSITIPMMKETGYNKEFAGAVESCASTAGMFTPPIMGATAFLIAEFLSIPYWDVVLAAALPAMIFYIVLFGQVDLEAVRQKLKGMPKEKVPSFRETLKRGWHFLIPIVFLLVLLGVFKYSAQSAIMLTLGCLIFVSSFKKDTRLNGKKTIQAMKDSAQGMMNIAPLCAAIGIILGSLLLTGVGVSLSSQLLNVSGGNVFVLLLMAAVASFILGMGMTAVTCYILTVALMAPALIKLGIAPIAAHMFLFYFGCVAFITPPVSVGAYVAAGISGGNPWETGVRAMFLGSAAFIVPWSFAYNPALLMVGSASDIIREFIFCGLGALFMAPAIVGYIWLSPTRIRWWERLLLGLSGLFLLGPFTNYAVVISALVVITVITLKNIVSARKEAGSYG
jgi:TRAP transporter 4TM/12TM fusion protein